MTKKFCFPAALIATAAALSTPATAMAQSKQCISRDQAQAVVGNLMPTLLRSVADRCTPLLGKNSYLATDARALAGDLEPHAQRSWPVTKVAFEKMGGNPIPDNPQLVQLGRTAIAGGVANSLDAESCGVVDKLTSELSPLPAENFTNVFALFLELGLNDDKKAPYRICEGQR